MTRRELTDAVLEAAKNLTSVTAASDCKMTVSSFRFCALLDALDALAACREPDLAALDHAVAEAVEAYAVAHPDGLYASLAPKEWKAIVVWRDARREALKPKPRYEAHPAPLAHSVGVWDNQEKRYLPQSEVAALLNREATDGRALKA